jgi:hypothetical protein
MKRILLGLAAGLAATALLAPPAFAHGGQFRGPGGSVPPGLREPTDPTPPPAAPPTNQPPTTTPSDPSTPPPPTTTPTSPNVPPPPTTMPDPGQGPVRKNTPTSFDQWVFWWNNNNDDILHLKEAIYRLRGTPNSPLASMGETKGNRTDATRATEKQVKSDLIPVLLWAMDHKNNLHPDIESAAYIALAKVTDDPAHFRLLMNGIYKDGKENKEVDQIVRESAALSLGLIRRGGENKFDAKEIDRVRDFLFTVFEDDGLATQTRGFAALAIGMLGDQPTTIGTTPTSGGGLLYAPDPAATALLSATDRIWELLHRQYKNPDLPICLMLALSLQRPDTIKPEMMADLRDCALKGKLFKENVDELVASYAALSLGRCGGRDEIMTAFNAMTFRQTGLQTKRSAAIALGQLGRRVDGADRADVAAKLWKAYTDVKDDSAKNFAIMSMAYVLEAEVAANRTDVINAKGVKLADELLDIADKGKYSQRPYGALAVGLVGAKIGDKPDIVEYGNFRAKASEVLLNGLRDQRLDKRGRAAFAVGLGILGESAALKQLTAIVADKGEDKEFRGYAAVAIGMIGGAQPEAVKAIREALLEHSSEELRQQTAIALGLLGTPDAVSTLLKELDAAESQNVQGQVVLALAKIGDAQAIEPLIKLMQNKAKPDLTRALACAGLGLIGDLELIPSLARISKDINYRAVTDVIREVLSIL